MRIARIVSQLATGVFSRKLIRSGRQVGSICTDDCIGGDSRREIQWDDGFDLAVRLEGNQVVVSSPPPSFTPNNHAGSDDATYVRPIAERSVLIVAEAQTVERVVNEGGRLRRVRVPVVVAAGHGDGHGGARAADGAPGRHRAA